MGLYQSIYIGPYLTVKNKTVDSTRSEIMCVSCQTKTTSKFCPNCGKETQSIFIPIKKKLDVFSFLIENKLDGDLWVPNLYLKDETVLVSNNDKGRPYKVSIDGDRGASVAKSLLNFNQKEDMEWFTTKNSEVIKTIEDEFGAIKLDWGIVIDWS